MSLLPQAWVWDYLPANKKKDDWLQLARGMESALLVIGIIIVISPTVSFSKEPTYEQAVARWPDPRRPVTFLGCKDHPDEFAVMWNGNLSLKTTTSVDADKRLFRDRQDDSLQVSFSVGDRPDFRNRDSEDGYRTFAGRRASAHDTGEDQKG